LIGLRTKLGTITSSSCFILNTNNSVSTSKKNNGNNNVASFASNKTRIYHILKVHRASTVSFEHID
jgi:hypothetical protein